MSHFDLFPSSWYDLSDQEKLDLLIEALDSDKLLSDLDFFKSKRYEESTRKLYDNIEISIGKLGKK